MPLILTIILGIVAGVLIIGLNELWIQWRLSRIAARALERAGRPDQNVSKPAKALEPESRFKILLSETEVVCERPDGKTERVAWSDLQKVEVVTTSDGPMSPDVFWVLHGTTSGCAIPQGATGDSDLLKRLQALPGFDNGTFIKAMSSCSDQRFLCWQKPS